MRDIAVFGGDEGAGDGGVDERVFSDGRLGLDDLLSLRREKKRKKESKKKESAEHFLQSHNEMICLFRPAAKSLYEWVLSWWSEPVRNDSPIPYLDEKL